MVCGLHAESYLGALQRLHFSDMWEFNASTKLWTWVAGPNGPMSGVYGSLGSPAAGNYPGGRNDSSTWKDTSGNFWLFGGEGADSIGNNSYLNDLWKFNPSTLETRSREIVRITPPKRAWNSWKQRSAAGCQHPSCIA